MTPWQTIAERIAPGSIVETSRPLLGGVSAVVHALELRTAEGEQRHVVVRRQGSGFTIPIEAEFALMETLHRQGLSVPQPLLFDDTLLDVPFLVMCFVEGTHADRLDNRRLRTMANWLAALHTLTTDALPLIPTRLDPICGLLDDLPRTTTTAALLDAAAACRPHQPRNRPALLHGDFWPGNLLWKGTELAAILDWEDAAVGDPLADLAGARVELLWAQDEAAARTFTEAYVAANDIDLTHLPLWELYVASTGLADLDTWGLPEAKVASMRAKGERVIERVQAALQAT